MPLNVSYACDITYHTMPYQSPYHTIPITPYHQRSHNLGKFPQIFAVSMGVVLGIMRIVCIPFKILLFG